MGQVAVDVAAGFFSGIAVTLIGHPLETLKVRLQTQPSPPNHLYDGLVDCAKKTWATEGMGGFYKGVAAPLAGQLFFRSAMFLTNGWYLRWMSDGGSRPVLSYPEYALGGSITWGLGTLIECPLNVMSSQMQVQVVRAKGNPDYKPEFAGVLQYAREAPRKYGLRALYRGFSAHVTRNCISGALHFGLFEWSRREYAKANGVPVTQIGLAANMAAGGLGGIGFWLSTYPLDVIKSALQGDDLAKPRYSGPVQAAKALWAEGGAARFTRGLSACLLRAVPANAALLATAFTVKEAGYAYLARKE